MADDSTLSLSWVCQRGRPVSALRHTKRPEWDPMYTVGGADPCLTTRGEASTQRPVLKVHFMARLQEAGTAPSLSRGRVGVGMGVSLGVWHTPRRERMVPYIDQARPSL